MSQDLQLDRAILETKERAELHAIADALKIKAGSRAKKSEIIDLILQFALHGSSSNYVNHSGPNDAEVNSIKLSGVEAEGKLQQSTDTDLNGILNITQNSVDMTNGDTGSKLNTDESVRPPRANISLIKAAESNFGYDDGDNDPDIEDSFGLESVSQNGKSTSNNSTPSSKSAEADSNSHKAIQAKETKAEKPKSDSDTEQKTAKSNDPSGSSNSSKRNRRRRGGNKQVDKNRGEQVEQGFDGQPIYVEGLLDLKEEGYGFLRTNGYFPSNKDVYVSLSQVRKFALRRGDWLVGGSRPPASNEKYPALLKIDSINGIGIEEAKLRPKFEDLTPLFPDSKLTLELPMDPSNLTARIVDLLSPIGKGQRGLIVSPPKAGKTTIMKQIARSIEANNPDVKLMVLLVDERPEEVTDMRRTVKGEVVASTFDRPHEEHTIVSELTIERAKRLVELGQDVVIILDGITRLARAYNLAQPASGRVMSGGVDSGALYPPKKFFGAARNTEEGGSLTILATALVETGSKMDEVIFEEFKGTGNMELRLDRRLAERRIYPAIDVNSSSTRHEELLFDRVQLQQVWKLRRALNMLAAEGNNAPGLELLMDRLKKTHTNDEFLAEMAKSPSI